MAYEKGKVNDQFEPCLFIEFENGKRVEFMIDTGFNGALCLPRWLMDELELVKVSEVSISGVGQHKEMVDMALANIIWFGQKMDVEILINDGEDQLLGSELLDGKILKVNYKTRNLSIRES
jgi:clan AA aspartic protease